VDVNQMVLAACDFLGFDHRFRAVQIETRLASNLPARVVIPDHLNEVLMVVLQHCLEKSLHSPASHILVATREQEQAVRVRVDFELAPTQTMAGTKTPLPDHLFKLARRRLREMGGTLLASQTMVEISLPAAAAVVDASHHS
jgi:hypothetical protein